MGSYIPHYINFDLTNLWVLICGYSKYVGAQYLLVLKMSSFSKLWVLKNVVIENVWVFKIVGFSNLWVLKIYGYSNLWVLKICGHSNVVDTQNLWVHHSYFVGTQNLWVLKLRVFKFVGTQILWLSNMKSNKRIELLSKNKKISPFFI